MFSDRNTVLGKQHGSPKWKANGLPVTCRSGHDPGEAGLPRAEEAVTKTESVWKRNHRIACALVWSVVRGLLLQVKEEDTLAPCCPSRGVTRLDLDRGDPPPLHVHCERAIPAP